MGVQEIIAGAMVVAALAYVGQMIYKRTGFSRTKAGCESDCGCSGKSKPPRIAA